MTTHVDHVCAVAAGETAYADNKVSTSWTRSAVNYGVDPASDIPPRILTAGELKNYRESVEKLVFDAQDELDYLYTIVREAGYVVLLCDKHGVAVDHRGNEADAARFLHSGTWVGGIWSEKAEGTNGIGTCIAELQPVTIHQGQHFRSRHIGLSCSGAPIFNSDGELIGVLDVSSIDPKLSENSHGLTGALVEASARSIGERLFREQFPREWIIAVAASYRTGSAMLFAVDEDQRIVGADRNARQLLARYNYKVEDDASLWSVFEREPALFHHKDRCDLFAPLMPADTAEQWLALVTPPDNAWGAWRSPESTALHSRPRLSAIASRRQLTSPRQARGSLDHRRLKRVLEFIDSHLQENITVESLASIACLSRFHFSRAFKAATGRSPQQIVSEKRLAHAKVLLADGNESLVQIALTLNFSSQANFCRAFQRAMGLTPGEYRAGREKRLATL